MEDTENKPNNRYAVHIGTYNGKLYIHDTVHSVLHPCRWGYTGSGPWIETPGLEYPVELAYCGGKYQMPSAVVERICYWLNTRETDKPKEDAAIALGDAGTPSGIPDPNLPHTKPENA